MSEQLENDAMPSKKDERPKKGKTMVKKHRLFVEEYLTCFVGASAYRAVYGDMSDHSAAVAADRVLSRPDVQQYLSERLEQRKKQLHVDQSYVVRKLTEVAEADFVKGTQYLSKDDLDNMPAALRKMVQSIEMVETHTSSRNSDFSESTTKYKVTFMSKDAAIANLAKHTGTFAKDNVQGNYDLGKKSFTAALKELGI